jgi:hypothetical protein
MSDSKTPEPIVQELYRLLKAVVTEGCYEEEIQKAINDYEDCHKIDKTNLNIKSNFAAD